MKKLNLHLHTNFSDGNSSMEVYADKMKNDFACLVTSDHDYMMTLKDYENQLQQAKEISLKYNFPIICTLEISLWHDEAILIGTQACRKWLVVLDRIRKDLACNKLKAFTDWYYSLPKEEFMIILVHPHGCFLKEADPKGFNFCQTLYQYMDGAEVGNHGHVASWLDGDIDSLLPKGIRVMGIDAHNASTIETKPFSLTCMDTIAWDRIDNEKELMEVLRTKDFVLNQEGVALPY